MKLRINLLFCLLLVAMPLHGQDDPDPENSSKDTIAVQMLKLWSQQTSMRTWNDKSGEYTLKAQFVKFDLVNHKVILKQEDGKQVAVLISRLSTKDLQAVKDISELQQNFSIIGIKYLLAYGKSQGQPIIGQPPTGNPKLQPVFQQMVSLASIPVTGEQNKEISLHLITQFQDIKSGKLRKTDPRVLAWEGLGKIKTTDVGKHLSKPEAQALVQRLLNQDRLLGLALRNHVKRMTEKQGGTPEAIMKEILIKLNQTAGTSP